MSFTFHGGTSERDYFGYLIEPDFSQESSAQGSGAESWTPSPAPLSNVGPSVTDGQRGLSDDLMTPDFGDEDVSNSPDDRIEREFWEDEHGSGYYARRDSVLGDDDVANSSDDRVEREFWEDEHDSGYYARRDSVLGDDDVANSSDDRIEREFWEDEHDSGYYASRDSDLGDDEDEGSLVSASSPDLMDPDFGDDDQGPDIDRSAPSPAPQSAGSGDSGLATLSLPDIYASETRDASLLRQGPGTWQAPIDREYGGAGQGPRLGAVRTRYFDQQEQAQSEISVQDGLLRQQGGDLMDTTQASGTGTFKMSGQGKHLFSLTPEGQVRATDPWASKQINTVAPNEAHSYAPAGATSLDFVNHSSLVAGGSVAGAGELRTERGQLQQISDSSGHYQPQGQHMGQVVDHFEGQGVDMHDVGLRFTGKQSGQRPLIASAREFQAQDNPATAENAMRTRRANLSDELQRTVTSREQRLGLQNEESTNY